MVGGINTTLANVIVAVVMFALVIGTPLAVWIWNRRTGKFSALQAESHARSPRAEQAAWLRARRTHAPAPSDTARPPWGDGQNPPADD